MTLEVSRKFQQPTTAFRCRCWSAQEARPSRISTLAAIVAGFGNQTNPENHIGLGADYSAGLFGNLEMFVSEDNKRGARFI